MCVCVPTVTALHNARGRRRLSIKYELLSSWYGENVPELLQVKEVCTEGDASEYFDDDRPSLGVKLFLQYSHVKLVIHAYAQCPATDC